MAQFRIDLRALEANAKLLAEVAKRSDCTIIAALKAFALPSALPTIAKHLPGACASGLWEAKLARQVFAGPIVTCAPAYRPEELEEICQLSDIVDFNHLGQWLRLRERALEFKKRKKAALSFGLRINPELSTQTGNALYDPCQPGSRLGTPLDTLLQASSSELDGLSGLHFHSLCEQGFEPLERTLAALEERIGSLLRAPWCQSLNIGGGHWITQPDYDRSALIALIAELQERWQLRILLEPGEAVAIHTGVLRAQVLDVFMSGEIEVAILDVSATAHMPDVLEMPYRPELRRVTGGELAAQPEHKAYSYRLGGPSCLAGDVLGDFSFEQPLEVGEQLDFLDMAHYTMVKTTMFNGVAHPDIVLIHPDGHQETVRQFSYEDFLSRMGQSVGSQLPAGPQ